MSEKTETTEAPAEEKVIVIRKPRLTTRAKIAIAATAATVAAVAVAVVKARSDEEETETVPVYPGEYLVLDTTSDLSVTSDQE